jgi:Leucine-rich repeat (LRR) protein
MALKELNSLSFNKADYLQYIFLQNNHLTVIRDHVFVHCKNLKSLDLSKNKIKSISKNAFNSLAKLEQLNLSGNKIRKIEHDIFEPLISIEYIWLSHNQLQEISSNLFTEQNQKLISIYLNNNKLTSISPHAFEKLDNLNFLFLKGNKCVNADFTNYRISSNVGIKYEMKNCIKAFQKAHPDEEKRFNLTAKIDEIHERMELCKSSIGKFLDEEKSMLDSIQNFNETE